MACPLADHPPPSLRTRSDARRASVAAFRSRESDPLPRGGGRCSGASERFVRRRLGRVTRGRPTPAEFPERSRVVDTRCASNQRSEEVTIAPNRSDRTGAGPALRRRAYAAARCAPRNSSGNAISKPSFRSAETRVKYFSRLTSAYADGSSASSAIVTAWYLAYQAPAPRRASSSPTVNSGSWFGSSTPRKLLVAADVSRRSAPFSPLVAEL